MVVFLARCLQINGYGVESVGYFTFIFGAGELVGAFLFARLSSGVRLKLIVTSSVYFF